MTEVPHEFFEGPPEPSKTARHLKALSIICLIIGAIYSMFKREAGGAVFTIAGLIILLFTIIEPGDYIPTFLPQANAYIGKCLRKFYQRGDKLVRIMMILLCIGGSASICKFGIGNFSVFPEGIDVAVKRLGPALAGSSILVYPAFVLSKRVFVLSMWQNDEIVRRYEIAVYVAVTLFCITLFGAMACFKMEEYIPSAASESSWIFKKDGKSIIPGFHFELLKIFLWICCIWAVWAIGLGACLLLRFFDKSWRLPSSVVRVRH